jgi:TolB-like protein/Flp pilus assembly protein TadD/tRNA A-37 threonylcarbamoyl transferase component Bud32
VSGPAARLAAAIADRYAFEREIGTGGMATVHLARDVRHQRRVAVKVLSPELGAALGAERFLAEIRVTANLQHPNIVPLFDSGEAEGLLYYVMPYVEGESLRDRMRRERQLPIDEALRITQEVGEALAYAHCLGIVHRDVKPENILLAQGHALVTDFGVARAVSAAGRQGVTEVGVAVGTPAYMSPEQAAADPQIDGRSDQYSLACVLYEMLAGEPPFTAPTAQATLARRFTDPVPSLRAVRETVPAPLEAAVRRALARTPADRFATATGFTEAIRGAAAAPPKPRSVAVLPFLNLSADPENEYFADGITEDVIAQLSKIRALHVVSRTSVMPFKKREQGLRDIAARLQVATLLEGSVRRAGTRVRIVAQLIDAATDQHLWAETYDREMTDIFAIQSEVAEHIAAALRAELSHEERVRLGREPTSDLRAYQLYLQGRHSLILFDDDGMRQAITFFERAIALDPGYALAHAGLAMAYTELGEVGALRPGDAYPHAKAAAARALELDDELGDAHCTAGFVRFVYDFDWTGAEAEFRRALQLSPSNADAYDLYGRMCSAIERYDEAIAYQRRAQELDPLAHRFDLATALLRAGRNEDAVTAAAHAVEVYPHFARGHATYGWACLATGRGEEGLAALERAVAMAPAETQWLAQLGQAYGQTGRPEKAREILARLEERARGGFVAPNHLAYVYTGLGEHDRAIDCLEQAFEERAGAIYGIKGSFLFARLRGHPRFTALLRKMNLG